MDYILIEQDDGTKLYQCVQRGYVVAYRDIEGEIVQPVGGSCVVDANPTRPAWDVPDPEPVTVPVVTSRRLSKLEFVGRLGGDFANILNAAKQNVEVELFVKMLDWATPEPDGTSIDLDDERVIYALTQLEKAGLIASAQEILNA